MKASPGTPQASTNMVALTIKSIWSNSRLLAAVALFAAAGLCPLMASAASANFEERWSSTTATSYSPEDLFFEADAGTWLIGDTVSEFPECGPTPHRATISTVGNGKALTLNSVDSNSDCADNIWVAIQEVPGAGFNGGFAVTLASNTIISFDASGSLPNPEKGRDTCLLLPCGDTVSMSLQVLPSGSQLTYILQRAPDAVPNTRHDFYREIFLDPNAGAYQRNLMDDLMTIPNFNPNGAEIRSIEFAISDPGSATLDNLIIAPGVLPPPPPPPRLSSPAVIELPVVGLQLRSPFGEVLGVPLDAVAVALNVTAVNPTAAGFITVWPCGVERPLASNVNYVAGDIVPNGVIATVGGQGSVCFYSQRETDLVVDIAGWFEGTAYTGATPTRLNDTRNGTGGRSGRVDPNSPLTIQVTGLQVLDANGVSTTIPSTIGAVALNVTVVQPARAGFVTVWPCDVARPLSSNVNFTQSQVVANGVIAPVSAAGTVCLFSLVPTDIVVDLAGWFPEQSFSGTTPTRLVDTRNGTGGRSGTITSTDELSVPIHNITLDVGGVLQEVPVTATAAALNVTIVNPVRAGFATIWPCSVSRPLASNLNYVAGQIVANNVIAPIGNDGTVCVYSSAPAHVIVDIAGWFSPSGSGALVGTNPERLIDTRDGKGPAPQ